MYDSPLSSCRAATCWRGACDAFMYFENRRLEECTHAVQIVANLHVPQNRPVGFGLRNYTIREKHQIQSYSRSKSDAHKRWPKGAVYTVWVFICICMSLRVFLFAKKMKFLTKGGIHCISQVFPWHFYFMREHSLVELTEHDDSAANIIVHSMYTYMYCCIHSTY